ncbi:MAG TPA: hypothetical protein PKY82_14025 [Pyrinomonadaceae bacterium]|nr:hypothetical protein [Pyrinomonadaceae bacterium]
MKKRNTPNEKKDRIVRERDPIPWRYCLLTLVCGLLLVVGFFWAARQHFSAMDFGIRNAKLRDQKKSLEDEQRRLYLTKEISLSPAEIKKLAKKIGLQDLTSANMEVIVPENKAEKTGDKTLSANSKKPDEKNKTNSTAKEKLQSETVATPRPQIARK